MTKISVLEADGNLRAAIAAILELAGYTVSTAADGSAGITMMLAELPALVLCDANLPFVDGYGVLQWLRNQSPPMPPLIFLTAHLSQADLQRGIELGANGYLMTPFKEEELLDAVRNALNPSE